MDIPAQEPRFIKLKIIYTFDNSLTTAKMILIKGALAKHSRKFTIVVNKK